MAILDSLKNKLGSLLGLSKPNPPSSAPLPRITINPTQKVPTMSQSTPAVYDGGPTIQGGAKFIASILNPMQKTEVRPLFNRADQTQQIYGGPIIIGPHNLAQATIEGITSAVLTGLANAKQVDSTLKSFTSPKKAVYSDRINVPFDVSRIGITDKVGQTFVQDSGDKMIAKFDEYQNLRPGKTKTNIALAALSPVQDALDAVLAGDVLTSVAKYGLKATQYAPELTKALQQYGINGLKGEELTAKFVENFNKKARKLINAEDWAQLDELGHATNVIVSHMTGKGIPSLSRIGQIIQDVSRLGLQDAKYGFTLHNPMAGELAPEVIAKALPGYAEEAGQAPAFGLSTRKVRRVGGAEDNKPSGPYFRSTEGGSKFVPIDEKNVMPAPIQKGLDTFVVKDPEGYAVIEGQTGSQIGDHAESMALAISSAKKTISELPPENLDKMFNDSPLSPRYEEVPAQQPSLGLPTRRRSIVPTEKLTTPATPEIAATEYYNSKISPEINKGKAFVIGADDLKDHFGKDYNDANHPIYSKAAFQLYEKALKETPSNTVVFTGGGPGAGKTELLVKKLVNDGFDGVIYDSNMSSKEGVMNQINLAREAGKKVKVYGVIPDLGSTRVHTVLREMQTGRGISDKTFARGHAMFPKVIRELLEEGFLKESEVNLLDTRGIAGDFKKAMEKVATGGFVKSPLATLKKIRYSETDIATKYGKENYRKTNIGSVQDNRVRKGSSEIPLRERPTGQNADGRGDGRVLERTPKKEEVDTSKIHKARKLEIMAENASSVDNFVDKSGITRASMDKTVQVQGYKDSKDFFDKVKAKQNTETPKPKTVETPSKVSTALQSEEVIPLMKELRDLKSQIKRLDGANEKEIVAKIEEVQNSIALMDERIAEMPGRSLIKYRSKKEGEFLDFKNPKLAKAPAEAKRINDYNEKVIRASEKAFEGTILSDKYDDPDVIREAIDEYLKASRRRKEMQRLLKEKRSELNIIAKRNLIDEIADEGKTNARKALENLTDFEILSMDKNHFAKYLEGYLNERQAHRQARIALQATINDREFIKWENARKALKLPDSFDKMTVAQLNQLNDYLQPFKQGDVFLGPRVIKTLNNTDLKGLATYREVLDRTLESINKLRETEGKPTVTIEELKSIQPKESWKFMGGNALVRQNPFFEGLIHDIYKADIESGLALIDAKEHVNTLFDAARKSRKRDIFGRLIPTDDIIFHWLESSPEDKLILAKKMTAEEIKAGQYVQSELQKMRDELISGQVLKRYVKGYITHIRRSFLEAWKEGGQSVAGNISGEKDGFWARAGKGARAAFRELLDQYKNDEEVMNILNGKTGQVLPLEKWFQFSQKRSGQLVPSKNVARAFLKYKETFERKRALDSVIPKYQAIVDSLTPLKTTPRGLEFDPKLKEFYKTFMNTQKGRTSDKFLLEPGGKLDWAVRSGTSLVRLLALGFNIPVGIASQVGAQTVAYKGLGEKAYAIGMKRLASPRGRRLAKKYAPLVGEPVLERLREASARFGDKLNTLAFGLFSNADRNSKMAYLLGSLTKEEWKNAAASLDRLSSIKLAMGRQMPIEGMGTGSVMGKTALGSAVKQFKGWAIPIISTTVSDANKILRGKVPINSREGKELARSIIVTSAVVFMSYTYMQSNKNKKDRSFVEEVAYKAAQDSLSIIGALDPTLYTSSPALLQFVGDIVLGLKQITLAEKTTDGDLKGVNTLERKLTPKVIKQIASFSKAKDTAPASQPSSRGSVRRRRTAIRTRPVRRRRTRN